MMELKLSFCTGLLGAPVIFICTHLPYGLGNKQPKGFNQKASTKGFSYKQSLRIPTKL